MIEFTRENRKFDWHDLVDAITSILTDWEFEATEFGGTGGGYSEDIYICRKDNINVYFNIWLFWPDDGSDLMAFVYNDQCCSYEEDIENVIEILKSLGFEEDE